MSTIKETLAQAKACHDAGQLRESEQLYRQILEVDSANAEAHCQLGIVLAQQRKLDEAISCFEQACRLKPDSLEMSQNLRRALAVRDYLQGMAMSAQGNLSEAAACYRRVLQLQSDNVAAQGNLGHILRKQGMLEESAACYRRILELDPKCAEAHNDLGITFEQQSRLDKAIGHYRRAVELRPDFAYAHNNLGAVLAKQNELAEAVACYRRALNLKPDFAEVHNNLGTALAAMNELGEAADCCRRALALRPDYTEAHHNLGLVLAKQNKPDEAATCYRQALEVQPDFAEAHNNLGISLADQNQLEEAIACYRQALNLKPDYPEARNNLGLALIEGGQLAEAETCYRQALLLHPDHVEARINLGLALAEQNKLAEAIECYGQALKLKPGFAEVHYNLGAALAKQEKLSEAAACYQRALELKPDFAAASSTLGELLTRQERVAEAKECYLKAMQSQPKQDVWRLNVASLCPSVFNSSQEIEHYRDRLLCEIEQMGNAELRFEIPAVATSASIPSFNLQFHGHNDRPIREAYARLFKNCFPNGTPTKPSGHRPRIGFVVTEQHENIFRKSMRGILDRISQDLFELVVICSDRGISVLRSAIRNQEIRLIPVPNKFDQYVDAIRAARFDVLYYWEVGTDSFNYFLPFLRLAPVQCTSWGIQGTSGIPQLDCYLSSMLSEPEDARTHYTERLVLARTLLTYQQRVSVPSSPKNREFFGIASDRHVYLCAQHLGKFHPDFDPILAGILRADGKGVVVITEDRNGGFIARQLRRRFSATIPDVARRILFLPFQATPDYLSLTAAADVLLDPLHFGGVNTSYDGFSFNKPIVTLPSRFQRGRYTLGCYRKMGVSECVASNPQQYVDIAVAMGTDAEFRAHVVEKIRLASPVLFEDMEAVREHERIFGALVEEARSGCRRDGS